jgi:hypothetical protein
MFSKRKTFFLCIINCLPDAGYLILDKFFIEQIIQHPTSGISNPASSTTQQIKTELKNCSLLPAPC